MTSTAFIIVISVLILIAYLFDITAARTRIPSVILLLTIGWLSHQVTTWLGIEVTNLQEQMHSLLEFLGTIGLILIVFEGSIELEIERSELPLIGKSLLTATLPMVALGVVIAAWLVQGGNDWQQSILNAIPFCVVSSAIAIPTVRHLSRRNREFIVFESSMSDIIGVTLFGIFNTQEALSAGSFFVFLGELLLMMVISFVATGLLSFLLHRVEHKVKFAPIIFLVLLIYGVAKVYHLPALIFIMVLGLFLGNLDKLRWIKLVDRLRPETMSREVDRFHDIVIEATFLVRVTFFLLFGFLLQTEEIVSLATLPFSLGIIAMIFSLRAIQLWILRLPLKPLLFVAPRGLITVLLFLSVPAHWAIPEVVNRSLVIQVVLLSTLLMMAGMILGERKPKEVPNESHLLPPSETRDLAAESKPENAAEPTAEAAID